MTLLLLSRGWFLCVSRGHLGRWRQQLFDAYPKDPLKQPSGSRANRAERLATDPPTGNEPLKMPNTDGSRLTVITSEELGELSELLESLKPFLDHLFEQRPMQPHAEAPPTCTDAASRSWGCRTEIVELI
ncbi:hypothetical protein [Actinophytocola oryzae]|uniref:hypothetical protein n=1 Tax=Actinophytocola oryzae TaxID=502181 RepID=UPI001063882B|nr:hypothetical protein [Actinophytocola oryzae]